MIKSELIELLASKQSYLDHHDVEAVVTVIINKIIDTLASGECIEIRGFGTFSLRYRPTRVSRNPKTGEAVSVEQKHFVHFKPGTELKQRVDKSSKQYPGSRDW